MNLSKKFVSSVVLTVKPWIGFKPLLSRKANQNYCQLSLFASPIFFRNSTSFFNSVSSSNQTSTNMHSEISRVDFPNLSIVVIPATQDNFMYLLIDKTSGEAAAVDPVEPERILDVLRQEGVSLTKVLTTHHHWDHAGGNEKLVSLHGKQNGNTLEVYGGDSRIEALTNKVGQGDKIELGQLKIDCLHTPCHTTGHICYFVRTEDSNAQKPAVFTGDTLFQAGCGRFFEGTPVQMHDALINKLSSLPDETLVFCGHEYTVNNLKFSLHAEPTNEDAKKRLDWAESQRALKKPTVPSTIAEEKTFNPFMRVTVPALQQKVGASDAVSCMGALRAMKDKF